MPDGGDLISDWPMLNGLLNACGMCDLIAIQANYSMGEAVHTGVTQIADGTADADIRLEVAMTVDSGIGVVRHAQAGYDSAKDVANGKGKLTCESIKVPSGGSLLIRSRLVPTEATSSNNPSDKSYSLREN